MSLGLALYDEPGEADPELQEKFFGLLRLPNGTWKTTYPRRLDDVNQQLLELLPRDRRLELMDVGISSGVSTLEWTEQLAAAGIAHRLTAADLVVEGLLVSWGKSLAVLFDESGRVPLLLEAGPVMRPALRDRALERAAWRLLGPLLRFFASAGRRRPVPLVVPELRAREEIELVQDDITVPGRFAGRFDVIRAANLVQPAYFDEETMQRILVNLHERLRDGGLLVLCRTTAEQNNRATIFRRRGERFLAEASLNGGSEVSELVLSL
jgi:hypothetical protein